MELSILKKRLSTFRTPKGYYRGVSDDLLLEICRAWEVWQGTTKDLAAELGFSVGQLSGILAAAKRANKNAGSSGFQELPVVKEVLDTLVPAGSARCSIELIWDAQKTIRFGEVEQLLEFLRKAA